MRLGCGYPMGPLALLDLIGLDTAYEILDTMYRQSRDRLHAPAPILKQMVTAGLRGRKTGKGFYTYEAPDSPKVVDDALTPAARRARRSAAGRPVQRSASSAPGRWQPASSRCSRRPATTCSTSRAARRRSPGSGRRSSGRWTRPCCAASSTQADRDAALARVSGSARLDDLADRDLVIEAVVEELSVKQALFATLDEICRPGRDPGDHHVVAAGRSSSRPRPGRPADVVGLHFFNPAPVMKLVEVVRTVSTADDVVATARAVCDRAGKHAVECGDRAGFIVNALLFPYLNDAVKMLQAHYATVEDIDSAMIVGCGYPLGPFDLLDVVGPRRRARDPAHALPRVPRARLRARRRCSSSWSPPATWAARPGRGFRDYS